MGGRSLGVASLTIAGLAIVACTVFDGLTVPEVAPASEAIPDCE